VGNSSIGKFVVDGRNLHNGREFLCTFSPEFDLINAGNSMYCNSHYALKKSYLGKRKSRFFCDKLSISHKDTWYSGGNAPCILSLPTDGGERLASQTRHFSPRRKYFKVFLDLTMCNGEKNIVTVTFNGNLSMNKISYLGLEWNPNSLVAKLTA